MTTPNERVAALRAVGEWQELARDTSHEHVAAVLAAPAWKDKSPRAQLAEVMKRCKGSANPRRVWFLLTGTEWK